MVKKLTKKNTYKATILLLEHYYKKTFSDDLGSLLGCMRFLSDGNTADSASLKDWVKAVNQIKKQQENNELTNAESYEAVRQYLEDYQDRGASPDVAAVLRDMYLSTDNKTINPATWKIWLQCIDDVKAGKGDFYLRLFKPQ